MTSKEQNKLSQAVFCTDPLNHCGIHGRSDLNKSKYLLVI